MHFITFLLLVFTAALPSYAEDVNDLNARGEIENVDVYSNNEFERQSISEVDISRYTGFVKSIGRGEFDDRFITVPDLLESLPSVQVNESGGIGSFSSALVRGVGGKQINYYLDGMLLNSPSHGSANINIPSVVLAAIDVFPDFTPVEFGSANIGGAINFSTRKLNEEDFGGNVLLSEGEFDNTSSEAAVWGNVAGWNSLAGASVIRAENNYPVNDEAFKTSHKTRLNDGFKQDSFFAKVGNTFNLVTINSLIQFSDLEKEIPTPANKSRDTAKIDEKNLRLQTVIDYELADWKFTNKAYFLSERNIYTDENGSVGLSPVDTEIHTNVDGKGFFSLIQKDFSFHRMIATLDVTDYAVKQFNRRDERFRTLGDRTFTVFSFSDFWQISSILSLEGTYRLYKFKDDVVRIQVDGGLDDINRFLVDEVEDGFQLGLSWNLSNSLKFQANIARQIRVPSIGEKYGNQGLFISQEDLKHEKANVIDAGIIIDKKAFSIRSSVFYRKVEDGIYFAYASGAVTPSNQERSELVGGEGSVNWKLNSLFSLNLNGALIDSKNLINGSDREGHQLPGFYQQELGATIFVNLKNQLFTFDYQYKHDLAFNPQTDGKGDAVKLVNVSWTYLFNTFSTNLTVNNALDRKIETFFQLPTPGRSITASVNFKF